jgi:hypothetical protein
MARIHAEPLREQFLGALGELEARPLEQRAAVARWAP